MVKKRVSITIEEEDHLKLKTIAIQRKETISELYSSMVKEFLNNEDVKQS